MIREFKKKEIKGGHDLSWGVAVFIADVRESPGRGRDIWKSPE